eukprot:XP_015134673.1 uncharacterized protein LOC107052159 isoform X1 [Gallus gallus]
MEAWERSEVGGGGGGGGRGRAARRERAPPSRARAGAAWRCSACLAEGARVPLCASQRLSLRSAHGSGAARWRQAGLRAGPGHENRRTAPPSSEPPEEVEEGERREPRGDDVKATQMRLFLGVPGAESFRPDVQHPACPDRRLLSCSNLCSQVLRTSRWQKGSGSLPAQATSGKKQHRFQSVGPSRKGHAARAAGRQEAEESAHP